MERENVSLVEFMYPVLMACQVELSYICDLGLCCCVSGIRVTSIVWALVDSMERDEKYVTIFEILWPRASSLETWWWLFSAVHGGPWRCGRLCLQVPLQLQPGLLPLPHHCRWHSASHRKEGSCSPIRCRGWEMNGSWCSDSTDPLILTETAPAWGKNGMCHSCIQLHSATQ